MADGDLKSKAKSLIDNVVYYWKEPPKNRYMSFKEIASYSVGGIGAYLIMSMGGTCLLASTNAFLTGTLGISPTDMYILYVIAMLSGIPLTGVRANIIDNTRNKAGKYRPYILTMGIPSAAIFVAMVWFPYDKLNLVVGDGQFFGKDADYVAKCAVILIFNIALQFIYYFYYDAYENLIHVLSPNSQERSDVASIKSVIYSLGPSIMNLITPIIAQNIIHTNSNDIRVYRVLFPVVGVIGSLLLVLVYVNTSEKIIKARTHVTQINFLDSLKAVAKNKYFWIIALAGWIGFLESSYGTIMSWLYNYGGACNGTQYGIIVTIYGNASLWGMVLAPFCIRKWGKRNVQIVTNLFNIIFILAMILFTGSITQYTIWLVLICLYFNAVVGSFAHVLSPSIQADIRDYQQYVTGERIDGMFSTITNIGGLITLATSSILPALQESLGMNTANAERVVNNATLMSRILPGTSQTIGEMLAEQAANGQDIYAAANALYDVDGVLMPLIRILILLAALGATLNVIPYFFYDFTEKKQQGVVRVLKIRALFEDYGNNDLKDKDLVEAIDLVNDARENAVKEPVEVSKDDYQNIKDKAKRKEAKKKYKETLRQNDEIDISKFVCEELDKFDTEAGKRQAEIYQEVYDAGLASITEADEAEIKAQLKAARALPKNTPEEKEQRKTDIELAKKRSSSHKYYLKYYGSTKEFKEPSMVELTALYDEEDELDAQIKELSKAHAVEKKVSGSKSEASKKIKAQIKGLSKQRDEVREKSKAITDEYVKFNRAADLYTTAQKYLVQMENFSHFDEIAALYDEAKERAEESERQKDEEQERRRAEQQAELEQRQAARAMRKNKK